MCVSRLSSQVSAYFKDATPESGTLPSRSHMGLALILGPARRQALLIDFSRDSQRRWDVGGGCNALCFTDHGAREGQRDWERVLSDSATGDSRVRVCCQLETGRPSCTRLSADLVSAERGDRQRDLQVALLATVITSELGLLPAMNTDPTSSSSSAVSHLSVLWDSPSGRSVDVEW
jgi:hypothetical protein